MKKLVQVTTHYTRYEDVTYKQSHGLLGVPRVLFAESDVTVNSGIIHKLSMSLLNNNMFSWTSATSSLLAAHAHATFITVHKLSMCHT
jgi:hypothetical protein